MAVTLDAQPMDAFDRTYIARRIAGRLGMIKGVMAQYDGHRLRLGLAAGAELDGERIGEVLSAAVRNEFPKIEKIRVVVIGAGGQLAERARQAGEEKLARAEEIASASEESLDRFVGCVACSPFAPDHMCVLTPERRPQCGRPYPQIKTGALYGYDDMSNIHHSKLHRNINSFLMIDRGECIDPKTGEWAGVNAAVSQYTRGRTPRVQLHSIDECPHTGCGCFRMIMFCTDQPASGIGIMAAGYQDCAPDGRSWDDLHYALAGKQAPGLAGAAPNYLRSEKFLAAHGGWASVVWVCAKIAGIMGDDLPAHVQVGQASDAG